MSVYILAGYSVQDMLATKDPKVIRHTESERRGGPIVKSGIVPKAGEARAKRTVGCFGNSFRGASIGMVAGHSNSG